MAACQQGIVCSGLHTVEAVERCVWCPTTLKNSVTSTCLLPHFLPHTVLSLHYFLRRFQVKTSALRDVALLAELQPGSGFSSLGGRRKSLTLRLFAVRGYT